MGIPIKFDMVTISKSQDGIPIKFDMVTIANPKIGIPIKSDMVTMSKSQDRDPNKIITSAQGAS
jgi:hypothetical protein